VRTRIFSAAAAISWSISNRAAYAAHRSFMLIPHENMGENSARLCVAEKSSLDVAQSVANGIAVALPSAPV
jgi:hypothetical protein